MSGQINEGGPAFPGPGNEAHWSMQGMSLRSYFAGQALAGIMSNTDLLRSANNESGQLGISPTNFVALSALGFADALIAELNKPAKEAS